MKADREPEISGSAQRQTKEKADENRAQNPNPAFPRISQMQYAKARRQQDRGWPETQRKTQTELGIATSEEFFVETYDQKERGPEQGKLERARSVQCELPEVKSMSYQNSLPKALCSGSP